MASDKRPTHDVPHVAKYIVSAGFFKPFWYVLAVTFALKMQGDISPLGTVR
jgi:hypothetical protein